MKKCLSSILGTIRVPEFLWDLYVSRRCGRFPLGAPHEVHYVPTVQRADCKEARRAELRRLPVADLPPKPPGTVRLVIVSDTHERHREVVLPPGDVFLHCGDILMSSSLTRARRGLRVLADFNEWLATVPCPERVVIAGNHDWALESLPEAERRALLSSALLLHDTCATLPASGIKVYGNSHSFGHSHNSAWQTREPQVSAECAAADVVVTHHCSSELEDLVMARARPLVWASGHVHVAHGVELRRNTLFVNASTATTAYVPSNPPFVVDIATTAASGIVVEVPDA